VPNSEVAFPIRADLLFGRVIGETRALKSGRMAPAGESRWIRKPRGQNPGGAVAIASLDQFRSWSPPPEAQTTAPVFSSRISLRG
jgi:hypothetical protein